MQRRRLNSRLGPWHGRKFQRLASIQAMIYYLLFADPVRPMDEPTTPRAQMLRRSSDLPLSLLGILAAVIGIALALLWK